jgi:hypothetical protein
MHFDDIVYTNAVKRTLLDPITPQLVGSFAPNVPAIATIGGKKFLQVESADTNTMPQSRALDSVGPWPRINIYNVTTNNADPIGGNTAEKIIGNTADLDHYIYTTVTPDGSSKYTYYVLLKAGGYNWAKLYGQNDGFPAVWECFFDLQNGVTGYNAGCDSFSITPFGSDYYLCVIQATSDSATPTVYVIYTAIADGPGQSYIGNQVDGLIAWNAQLAARNYPSSPIETAAGPVTRAQDQAYFSSGDVPAVISGGTGKYVIDIIPFFAHDEGNTYNMICAVSANEYLTWNDSLKKIELVDGAQKRVSNALTFPRYKYMNVIIDNNDDSIEVIGATTGDGKNIGTAYAWASANLTYGSYYNQTYQFNGLVSEPRNLP